jgi:hypothetical protein
VITTSTALPIFCCVDCGEDIEWGAYPCGTGGRIVCGCTDGSSNSQWRHGCDFCYVDQDGWVQCRVGTCVYEFLANAGEDDTIVLYTDVSVAAYRAGINLAAWDDELLEARAAMIAWGNDFIANHVNPEREILYNGGWAALIFEANAAEIRYFAELEEVSKMWRFDGERCFNGLRGDPGLIRGCDDCYRHESSCGLITWFCTPPQLALPENPEYDGNADCDCHRCLSERPRPRDPNENQRYWCDHQIHCDVAEAAANAADGELIAISVWHFMENAAVAAETARIMREEHGVAWVYSDNYWRTRTFTDLDGNVLADEDWEIAGLWSNVSIQVWSEFNIAFVTEIGADPASIGHNFLWVVHFDATSAQIADFGANREIQRVFLHEESASGDVAVRPDGGFEGGDFIPRPGGANPPASDTSANRDDSSNYATITDALAILRDVVGLNSSATVETHDFNGNDELDVGDALLTLRGLVGRGERQVIGEVCAAAPPPPVRFASAEEVEGMSGEELRLLAIRRNWAAPEMYTADDFGVPFLRNNDTWNGLRVINGEIPHTWWVNSADSREAAEQSVLSFRDGPIEFIGENELYYAFRVAEVIQNEENAAFIRRVLVFKDEVYSKQYGVANGSTAVGGNILREIRDLSRRTVQRLLDLDVTVVPEHTLYRDLSETDTQFVYTWYTLDWSSEIASLTRNQMVIDKATGRFAEQEYDSFGIIVLNRSTSETLMSVSLSVKIDAPSRDMIPLTDAVRERIERDWFAFVNPSGSDCCCFTDMRMMYLGTYGGSVAFMSFAGGFTAAIWSEAVGDYVFSYAHGYRIWLWNDGEFLPLGSWSSWCSDSQQLTAEKGAFEARWLTANDVRDLLFFFNRYYPRRFGCNLHGMRDCPECAYRMQTDSADDVC